MGVPQHVQREGQGLQHIHRRSNRFLHVVVADLKSKRVIQMSLNLP